MTSVTTASIRPVEERDLHQWIPLWNETHFRIRDYRSLLFEDAKRPKGEPFLRLGAWVSDGRLAGLAELVLSFFGSRVPGAGWGVIGVAPSDRRRGLGMALARAVEEFARQCALTRLLAEVLDKNLESAGPCLERLGFREMGRSQPSSQEPTLVDLSPLAPLHQRLTDEGIEAVAFSRIDSDANRRELWRVVCEIFRDMPTQLEWEQPPFEPFSRNWFEHPNTLPDAIFVARDEDRIIGLSALRRRPDGDAGVSVTGVLRAYRRRGIARLLKLMVTRYARDHGFARVHTNNKLANEAMLALNRQLGYVPGPVRITFEKRL